jgi:hypothetical protein
LFFNQRQPGRKYADNFKHEQTGARSSSAADSINLAIAEACDTMQTWLAAISWVVARIRSASKRCRPGSMVNNHLIRFCREILIVATNEPSAAYRNKIIPKSNQCKIIDLKLNLQ